MWAHQEGKGVARGRTINTSQGQPPGVWGKGREAGEEMQAGKLGGWGQEGERAGGGGGVWEKGGEPEYTRGRWGQGKGNIRQGIIPQHKQRG